MEKQLALITGASRGIGRAIAQQLAADGMSVIINYRQNAEAADSLMREILAAGGTAVTSQFDVADSTQVAECIAKLTDELGVIDVLVNNAGWMGGNPLLRVRAAELEQAIGLNVRGVFACTQAVLKTWAKIRYGRRVINITSGAAERGFKLFTVYSATKSTMIGFTKALAEELGPRGVTVNAVSPGVIETEATTGVNLDVVIPQTPLGRLGQPQDVADLVSFLVSDRAGFITGQVIRVNGGYYM
jgi:3-oxoacyl-[acyl-carrier protein] reductase